jgi:hypothetical protein
MSLTAQAHGGFLSDTGIDLLAQAHDGFLFTFQEAVREFKRGFVSALPPRTTKRRRDDDDVLLLAIL